MILAENTKRRVLSRKIISIKNDSRNISSLKPSLARQILYFKLIFSLIPTYFSILKDGGPVDKAAMRNDAAAELDRITRSKKIPPPDLNTSSEC